MLQNGVRQLVEQVTVQHGCVMEYLSKVLSSRVYDVCSVTPLHKARSLSAATGADIWLKREDTQPVFSFKLRGAYNKIANLDASQRSRGVVTCSAGNHAQGVAYSAAKLEIPATVVMPEITPAIKVDAVRHFGGSYVNVVQSGANF